MASRAFTSPKSSLVNSDKVITLFRELFCKISESADVVSVPTHKLDNALPVRHLRWIPVSLKFQHFVWANLFSLKFENVATRPFIPCKIDIFLLEFVVLLTDLLASLFAVNRVTRLTSLKAPDQDIPRFLIRVQTLFFLQFFIEAMCFIRWHYYLWHFGQDFFWLIYLLNRAWVFLSSLQLHQIVQFLLGQYTIHFFLLKLQS